MKTKIRKILLTTLKSEYDGSNIDDGGIIGGDNAVDQLYDLFVDEMTAIKALNNKGKALMKQINDFNKIEVTELPHLEVSNTDMMALIDNAYSNINTVVRNLERITGEETKKWIKEMLIKEIGRKIDVICDDSNNPPSVLDYNVLVAYVFYKLNNTVIERELIFGKTKDIIQFKADLLV